MCLVYLGKKLFDTRIQEPFTIDTVSQGILMPEEQKSGIVRKEKSSSCNVETLTMERSILAWLSSSFPSQLQTVSDMKIFYSSWATFEKNEKNLELDYSCFQTKNMTDESIPREIHQEISYFFIYYSTSGSSPLLRITVPFSVNFLSISGTKALEILGLFFTSVIIFVKIV